MLSHREHTHTGMTLLEVMVALAVLSLVGVTMVALVSAILASTHQAHAREAEVREAHRLLTAVSMWSTEELDQRLGVRRQGALLLTLERRQPGLYDVAVLAPPDSSETRLMSLRAAAAAAPVLLETVLYHQAGEVQ